MTPLDHHPGMRLVMLHRAAGNGARSTPALTLYRDPDRRGTLRGRLSVAALELAGGPGWYAVAVETGESLALIRLNARRAYAVNVYAIQRRRRSPEGRVCLGALRVMEPWVVAYAGWRYPILPIDGGIKADLLSPLAPAGWLGHHSAPTRDTAGHHA